VHASAALQAHCAAGLLLQTCHRALPHFSPHASAANPPFPPLAALPPTQGVEFWAVNTDAQALANHSALNKVQVGTELTRGLGCGGSPELGAQAALESQEALKKMLQVGGRGGVST